MHSRARPLVGRSLRRWRVAEARLRGTRPDTTERKDASLSATNAQWRYFHVLARSKSRLSAVSSDILVTTHQLRAAELQRASFPPHSPGAVAASSELVELSANLVSLANQEVTLGRAIGPTRMTIRQLDGADRPPRVRDRRQRTTPVQPLDQVTGPRFDERN